MIVEATGLQKSFGEQRVLTGVDLAVPEGSVLALLGPNGAGKTTTVRILTTLLRPDGGTARVAGHDVVAAAGDVRGVISLTGQYAAVDAQQTGRENLVMIGRLMHLGRSRARQRADELLERFELVDAGNRRTVGYSGGMRRRLDLAMSLVAEPRVIFLDEPTTGLDPASRRTMWDAIRELVAGGTTIVLTTQYLEEADGLADQIVVIDGGAVRAQGTADELKGLIGGERIDLRFADRPSAVLAADLLGVNLPEASTSAKSVTGTATGPGPTVGVPSDGSAQHLRHVLNLVADGGLAPLTVGQHRPTLDDVFLTLTGRAANHPDATADSRLVAGVAAGETAGAGAASGSRKELS